MKNEKIRVEFEAQPKEFYGGNNIQRDGDGYDSSYVNMKWELFVNIKQTLDTELITWLQHIQIGAIEDKEDCIEIGDVAQADVFRAEEDLIDLIISKIRGELNED